MPGAFCQAANHLVALLPALCSKLLKNPLTVTALPAFACPKATMSCANGWAPMWLRREAGVKAGLFLMPANQILMDWVRGLSGRPRSGRGQSCSLAKPVELFPSSWRQLPPTVLYASLPATVSQRTLPSTRRRRPFWEVAPCQAGVVGGDCVKEPAAQIRRPLQPFRHCRR